MATKTILRSEAGFTLVEVLAAMVILAIGLLGLEALGLGVARSLARAERQTDYAVLASDSLESALRQLREGGTPTQFCFEVQPWGDRLSRSITFPQQNEVRVTVTALPNTQSFNAPSAPFTVSTSAFVPNLAAFTPTGAPC